MSREERKRALVAIVGPTGSGKSALALSVAKRLDGEIVGCDALQVYRGVDVGTAKLAPEDRDGIRHHLLDVVDPDEEFSAARYVELAVPSIEDVVERGKLPLVVGGTGLYLRALRRGLFEGPGRSPEIRDRLTRLAARRGTEALHRVLRRWDPELAHRVHPNDRVRLIRGIEVFLQAGAPMSELMRSRRRPLADFQDILIGLRPSREVLARRIAARVSAMFAGGLPDEVRRLRDQYGANVAAFKAIGYREALQLLSGEIDEARAVELTTRATLQYAKRQMTWFRRESETIWFDGDGDEESVQQSVLQRLRREIRGVDRRQNPERSHAETAP